MDEFRRNRADVYRMAFWCLIRRFDISEMSDILEDLAICCNVCSLNEEQTEKILKETIENYLKQKGVV